MIRKMLNSNQYMWDFRQREKVSRFYMTGDAEAEDGGDETKVTTTLRNSSSLKRRNDEKTVQACRFFFLGGKRLELQTTTTMSRPGP